MSLIRCSTVVERDGVSIRCRWMKVYGEWREYAVETIYVQSQGDDSPGAGPDDAWPWGQPGNDWQSEWAPPDQGCFLWCARRYLVGKASLSLWTPPIVLEPKPATGHEWHLIQDAVLPINERAGWIARELDWVSGTVPLPFGGGPRIGE